MSVLLDAAPFNPADLLARFEARLAREALDAGAVVSFHGRVRGEGGVVRSLRLEAYPGFSERMIAEYCEEAAARHGLLAYSVVHRIGDIAPGGSVVFVATAAAHRRAAFEGADQMMDYLKSRAPFWKKSLEEGGGRWIDPRPQDYDDARRWD
jgi:molybdopterin synthase catalytic subunit